MQLRLWKSIVLSYQYSIYTGVRYNSGIPTLTCNSKQTFQTIAIMENVSPVLQKASFVSLEKQWFISTKRVCNNCVQSKPDKASLIVSSKIQCQVGSAISKRRLKILARLWIWNFLLCIVLMPLKTYLHLIFSVLLLFILKQNDYTGQFDIVSF